MKQGLITLALAALPLACTAAPFAKGDAVAGKDAHDGNCSSCHTARFGGDGSKMYTRSDRKVGSAAQLAQRITTCNANLGNSLFPEDELNVGAFLNGRYYKFK